MNYQREFISLIKKSNLVEIQSFYEQYKQYSDISALNEVAFRWTCENGHLDIAQWLYQIKPTIDISAQDEEAFRGTCQNGHLEVAQWLYHIKPTINISANNEKAFRYACIYGHLNVAKWLQSLSPYGLYYTFEVDENNQIVSYSTEKPNYVFLKKRFDTVHSGNEICFREALVRNRFHPKYMDKWVDWGHDEAEDFDLHPW